MDKNKQSASRDKCFYCGKKKNVIIQLDKTPNDREPCSKCEDLMKKGVMFCEVHNGSEPPHPDRTGRMFIMTEEYCERVFKDIDFKKQRFMFIPKDMCEYLGLGEDHSEEEEEEVES